MLDTNKIDLSIPMNQNVLISTFYEYFSIDELEQINIRHIQCPSDDEAIEVCKQMEFEKKFDTGSFKVSCILDTNHIPPTHHTRIEFHKGDIYHTTMECNPNPKNPYLLSVILAKAINFAKYKNHKDGCYNRRSVIDNVAKRASQIIPEFNILIGFRGRIAEDLYLNNMYKLLTPGGYSFVRYAEGERFKLEIFAVYDYILKVELSNGTSMDYAYFPKSDIGLNEALLVLDKAVVRLKDQMMETIPEYVG